MNNKTIIKKLLKKYENTDDFLSHIIDLDSFMNEYSLNSKKRAKNILRLFFKEFHKGVKNIEANRELTHKSVGIVDYIGIRNDFYNVHHYDDVRIFTQKIKDRYKEYKKIYTRNIPTESPNKTTNIFLSIPIIIRKIFFINLK